MSAKSLGPQTSRKASEVEVPATQNLTVSLWLKKSPKRDFHGFSETYHHGKIPLEQKKLTCPTTSMILQEVPSDR